MFNRLAEKLYVGFIFRQAFKSTRDPLAGRFGSSALKAIRRAAGVPRGARIDGISSRWWRRRRRSWRHECGHAER